MIEVLIPITLVFIIMVFIPWLILFAVEMRKYKIYAKFYSKYAVRKCAEVVYYQRIVFRQRGQQTYNIILRFTDDEGRGYNVSVHTNHHSAKKYEKGKEAEFLCLYDAIISDKFSLRNIESLASDKKEKYKLRGIPLAVLPEEENFVKNGWREGIELLFCGCLPFLIIGLLLFIL